MTLGQKIALIKERRFKSYVDFGKFSGVSGDWLLDLTKKDNITMIDISKLKQVAIKNKISLDWLLLDNNEDDIVVADGLDNQDLLLKLNDLLTFLTNNDKIQYNGISLGDKDRQMAIEGVKVLKQLINSRI